MAARSYDSATVESPLAHVLIEDRGDALWLAIRGTKRPADFVTDARFRLAPLDEPEQGRVHEGAKIALASVRDELRKRIWAAAKPVIGMGHSLGALMLVQLAAQIPGAFSKVVTFGEPRGGDATYAAYCDKQLGDKHVRVVNEEDIITRVPPWLGKSWKLGFGGYRHSGRCAFVPSMGDRVWMDPGIREKVISDVVQCAKAWWATKLPVALLEEPLKDHFMVSYIAALGRVQG
jgi:hypothetical protein